MLVPRELEMIVEVPRGGFVKREHGKAGFRIEYVSPFPCPFNYGCAPERPGLDGDPEDVVLLGPRRALGERLTVQVRGVVVFEDAGRPDPKWIASAQPISDAEQARIRRFFGAYAWARRGLNWAQGKRGGANFTEVRVFEHPGVW